MVSASSLLQQALQLDEAERAELADRLYESVTEMSPEWEKAWLPELERRWADYESGRDPGIPWEEAKKVLFASLPPE